MNILTLIKRITTSGKEYPEQLMSTDTCKLYTCINPYSYHIVRKNPQLYSNFDSIFVDGISMCWWIRILWGRKIPRLSFDMSGIAIDLFKKLNCKNNNESIYFIGSNKQNIDATINPKNATYNNLEWESSNNNIVSVTDNNFVIKGSGNVVLTVNTHDGVSASIELQVIDLNTTILLIGGCIVLGCICVILIKHVKK